MKVPRLALIVFIAVAAAAAQRQDYAAAGVYEVHQADITLHDSGRRKDLPLRIYYPQRRGKFPVIVFSHGAGGSGENYVNWGRQWASWGYVVIHPTHDDSIQLRRAHGERVRLLDPLRTAMHDEQAWRDRPRDISFILDSLPEIEGRIPGLRPKLDRERIGVGGHSFGAYTAQVIGGATSRIGNFADPRVRAVLLMSPQGRDQMGLTSDSWKNFALPAMIMTGPRDAGRGGRDPLWRRDPYALSPPGDKYFVWVEGASHMSFAGNERFTMPQMMTAIKAASTAFWNAYLKDDSAARQVLSTGILLPNSQKILRLDSR